LRFRFVSSRRRSLSDRSIALDRARRRVGDGIEGRYRRRARVARVAARTSRESAECSAETEGSAGYPPNAGARGRPATCCVGGGLSRGILRGAGARCPRPPDARGRRTARALPSARGPDRRRWGVARVASSGAPRLLPGARARRAEGVRRDDRTPRKFMTGPSSKLRNWRAARGGAQSGRERPARATDFAMVARARSRALTFSSASPPARALPLGHGPGRASQPRRDARGADVSLRRRPRWKLGRRAAQGSRASSPSSSPSRRSSSVARHESGPESSRSRPFPSSLLHASLVAHLPHRPPPPPPPPPPSLS
jgi:hypothetical protein